MAVQADCRNSLLAVFLKNMLTKMLSSFLFSYWLEQEEICFKWFMSYLSACVYQFTYVTLHIACLHQCRIDGAAWCLHKRFLSKSILLFCSLSCDKTEVVCKLVWHADVMFCCCLQFLFDGFNTAHGYPSLDTSVYRGIELIFQFSNMLRETTGDVEY